MPDIQASIEYLQKLKLYETEKPYYCLLAPHEGFDPDAQRLDNLEYEVHQNITITDMRKSLNEISIEECGFQVLNHNSKSLNLSTREECEAYRQETEDLLRREFAAVYVKCYEVRKRENIPIQRSQMDYNDPLLIEGPAKGAHNGRQSRDRWYRRHANWEVPGRRHLFLWTEHYQQESISGRQS
jgi:hypothetical protein